MERIYLLLGTNIGNLEENLERALRFIEARGIRILKKSKIYKTAPWGFSEQPDFLNLALEVASDLTPDSLLRTLKEIETQMGRIETGGRWLPRIIDVDILFMDDLVVDRADLQIPHREFFNRPFAIRILSEIAPDFQPPGRVARITDLLEGGVDEGIEIYRD
ncbi:2-amino-4-hydroxy-6-hydroxymethyldihydropteridine diphosphokinase [candidate division WOR-3 bacterium]|nr:2-amino-4-hydroxy-6-hydroxymethyldihydropteridine diphosphokinase [candidate division WOR-3 bacterium]